MRIVGGTLSGRRFGGPRGDATRPTAERVREALFSALTARGAVEGARVLDLYAGTGALAFEALSRGATSAVSVERDPRVARSIEADARALDLVDRHRVLTLDLRKKSALVRLDGAFGLVLADPPWAELDGASEALRALVAAGRVAQGGWVVLVHAEKDPDPAIEGLGPPTHYRYGDGSVAIYEA
jgi:16S rRNA (guanine966-N2)-methyltransferase